MQKIISHLWFDHQAEEAAEFYASLFKNSTIGTKTYYSNVGKEIHGQDAGKLMTVQLDLEGCSFMALNGGPYFKFTPAVSFLIACSSKEEVDTFWQALNSGGQALMELGAYPFSQWYGWTTDKYGVSWQIMHMGEFPWKQKITPTLMYVGAQAGKAEEAIKLYTSAFQNAAIGDFNRYGPGETPDVEGTVRHVGFTLEGQEFAAMDSAHEHKFTFSEATSFLVKCKDQAEIDHLWEKLTPGGDPASQQCGWLKDKYGVSWQIAPAVLDEMLQDKDLAKVERVTKAFLQMKKFDIAALEKAFNNS